MKFAACISRSSFLGDGDNVLESLWFSLLSKDGRKPSERCQLGAAASSVSVQPIVANLVDVFHRKVSRWFFRWR